MISLRCVVDKLRVVLSTARLCFNFRFIALCSGVAEPFLSGSGFHSSKCPDPEQLNTFLPVILVLLNKNTDLIGQKILLKIFVVSKFYNGTAS